MVGSIPHGIPWIPQLPQLPTSPEASVPSEVHLWGVPRQALTHQTLTKLEVSYIKYDSR